MSSGGPDSSEAAVSYEALLKGHIPGWQSESGNDRSAKRSYQQVDGLQAQFTSRCRSLEYGAKRLRGSTQRKRTWNPNDPQNEIYS